MKLAKVRYSSFLPNYPPPFPLALLVRPVSDGFAKPHLLRIECGPHRTLFLPLPCLRALNISTVNLSTGVRICWLLSSLTTTALVQSSIVSHLDFGNSLLPVSWNPLSLCPTFSSQSSHSGSS